MSDWVWLAAPAKPVENLRKMGENQVLPGHLTEWW